MAASRFFEDYLEEVVEFKERASKEKHVASIYKNAQPVDYLG